MRKLLVAMLVLEACAHPTSIHTSFGWQWTAPTPAYVGMPATGGAAVYGHSVLVRLDSRGGLLWSATLVGLRDVAPLVTADEVIAATDDGVAAFAIGDGALRWRVALVDRASTPVIAAGHPIVTTWDGRLVAVGAWTVSLDGDAIGPPAAAGGVVVASTDSSVAAFDATTGALKWRHRYDGDATSAPAIAVGLAIVVAPDFTAHAYDLATGRPRWTVAMSGGGAPEAPPAVGGNDVAVADRLGNLAVIDAPTGRVRWRAAGDGAVDRGGPVLVGRVVALPLDDGRLFVAGRHSHRWLRFGGARVSGVAAGGDRVYVTTREAPPSFFAALTVS